MKPKSLPSRLFNRNSAVASGEALSVGAARKYQRHVDCAEDSSSTDSESVADNSRQHERCHREIHFAFLPERYEPLTDDEAKEEKKKRKKEKYKKVKKPQSGVDIQPDACLLGCAVTYSIPLNVGKALRSTWKCMMLGLYNFALGYSTPITVAATFVPDFHRGRI